MYSLIKKFPQNLQEAISLANNANLKPLQQSAIQHVVITGMGSSGMAGRLVQQWVSDKLYVPLTVNNDYTLPSYVSEYTLLIVISYSGNTQETLAACQVGIEKGAHTVIVTSGGTLQTQAHAHGLDILDLPKSLPPRASLDYSTIHILSILGCYKLFQWDFIAEVQIAIQLISEQQASLQAEAEQVAEKIQGNIPVVYTTSPYEPVAIRLRQQLNENSKQLCWHHSIPELNHNEIVGWESTYNNLSILMLTGFITAQKLQLQQQITQDMLQKYGHNLTIVHAPGDTQLICSLYLIHVSDWISYYLAQKKGVDPMEVQAINQIKSALAKETGVM